MSTVTALAVSFLLPARNYSCILSAVSVVTRTMLADTVFARFAHSHDAAVQLSAGATATFVDSHFANNTAENSGDLRSGPAVGPDIGLQEVPSAVAARRLAQAPEGPAASARFHDCTFEHSLAQPQHSVAIDSSRCRVYSDSYGPLMYDMQQQKVVEPWKLQENPASPEHVEANSPADVFRKREFPTDSDPDFISLVEARHPPLCL